MESFSDRKVRLIGSELARTGRIGEKVPAGVIIEFPGSVSCFARKTVLDRTGTIFVYTKTSSLVGRREPNATAHYSFDVGWRARGLARLQVRRVNCCIMDNGKVSIIPSIKL